MKFLKGLFSILLFLAQLVAPIIWSISYIKMIFSVGLLNIPLFLNFVGIASLLVAYAHAQSFIKATNIAIVNHKAKKEQTP